MTDIPGTNSFYMPAVWGHDALNRIKRIYKYMLKYNAKVIKQQIDYRGWVTIEFEVYGLPVQIICYQAC